ncbi:MAG: YebC/PmpR family DNA-binding transcriptional regulator [bacterium]
MSGHSKWATIKRKKGKADAERGRVFTKLIKEITVSARDGGGDPAGNPRLRTAILAAKGSNMPADNIDRAIKKGTGELPGVTYEESVYEGYGPGGVAIFIDVLTDNRNRTTSEIRHLLTRNNGRLGEAGSVGWMFDQKGLIVVEKAGVNEDDLLALALDAGADDVKDDGEAFEIITAPSAFEPVRLRLTEAGITLASAEFARVPQNTITLDRRETESVMRLLDLIEEHDDVQKVSSNLDIPDEILNELGADA